ncbi:MAG: MarR family transcriptional regulator [Ruminococcaceae bacterium]|nr:MarR family transcriptional regulator [Oscillospiraceae bacterium]
MENNRKPDVIQAVMKVMRSMRRHPPMGEGFPPEVGRTLGIMAENDGVTSRELAELLDIRPSSLTELLGRLEGKGLVSRTPDENDRRVVRVSLTEEGRKLSEEHTARHNERVARASACFSEEEAVQFCEMCERLRGHLETLAAEDKAAHPECFGEGHGCHGGPHFGGHHCGGHHRGHGHGGHHRHGGFGRGEGMFPPPPPPEDEE